MDPVNIATAVGRTATGAYTVGHIIFDFWQGFCNDVSRQYATFSREIKQLETCWLMLRPFLQSPICTLTETILRPLHRIVHDTNAILKDLQQAVDQFRNGTARREGVIGNKFLKIVSIPELEQRRRFRKFIDRPRMSLRRNQMVYAKTLTDIVVAVTQCVAQPPTCLFKSSLA